MTGTNRTTGVGEQTSNLNPQKRKELEADRECGEQPDERCKHRKLVFCMAEALREKWRQAIRSGSTAAIMEDKKDSMHLVRFNVGSESNLDCVRGTLGMVDSASNSAEKSIEATQLVFNQFCTPGHGSPHRVSRDSVCDEALLSKLQSIVEAGVADGLQAAQNALILLRGTGFAPNMRTIDRDKAHAARSVYQRPWQHMDPETVDAMKSLVIGKHSANALIMNSPMHRKAFLTNQHATEGVVETVFQSMTVAHHRFSSHWKPAARFVLRRDGFLKTMRDIAVQRAGKSEGKRMSAILCQLTDEMQMMVGALADAGAEGVNFIRKVDKEDNDIEQMAAHVHEFKRALDVLFGDKGIAFDAVEGKHTFTYAMLRQLEKPLVLVFPRTDGGGALVLGGKKLLEDRALLRRCKQRMREWVAMTKAALDTEFPFWIFLNSFQVFDVRPGRSLAFDRVAQQQNLKRIAWRLRLDAQVLET